MFFMWSAHRKKVALSGTVPWQSSILRSYRSYGKGTITISFVASPEPQIVTIDSDSNEPTIPYGFGSQHPIVPPSLNDLNLLPKPFNVLATMAVIQADEE